MLANGVPYLMGTERFKGSHSMSGYHSFELCYLAQVYTNLLITGQPLDLYFKPMPDGFHDNILRVSPGHPAAGQRPARERSGSTAKPYSDFDAERMTVKLPRIRPAADRASEGALQPQWSEP